MDPDSTRCIEVEPGVITEILAWYKDEYRLVRHVYYNGDRLEAVVKFPPYPFVIGSMPFVSSNLINLAVDQCGLIHIGLLIEDGLIDLSFADEGGRARRLTFDDYNRLVGTEFVTGRLNARYQELIDPSDEIKIASKFNVMKKANTGRMTFFFEIGSGDLFNIKTAFVFPLNPSFISGG